MDALCGYLQLEFTVRFQVILEKIYCILNSLQVMTHISPPLTETCNSEALSVNHYNSFNCVCYCASLLTSVSLHLAAQNQKSSILVQRCRTLQTELMIACDYGLYAPLSLTITSELGLAEVKLAETVIIRRETERGKAHQGGTDTFPSP